MDELDRTPQMWAMYKEVMGYFANGVSQRPTYKWRGLRYSLRFRRAVRLCFIPHERFTSDCSHTPVGR